MAAEERTELRGSESELAHLIKTYATDLHWDAYESAPVGTGRLILVSGGILQGIVVGAALWAALALEPTTSALQPVLVFVGGLLAVLNVAVARAARPYYMRARLQAAITDPRPPLLYLRSFATDGQQSPVEPSLTDSTRPTLLSWGATWSIEDDLCQRLSGIAPVLCIGQPGDRLPKGSAIRLYVDNEAWQQVVGKLMQAACLVLIWPGASPGVRWELAATAQAAGLSKLVLLTADERGRPLDKGAYTMFREWVAPLLGRDLPKTAWHTWFLIFGGTGSVAAIDAREPPPSRMDFARAVKELVASIDSRLPPVTQPSPGTSTGSELEFRVMRYVPAAVSALGLTAIVLALALR